MKSAVIVQLRLLPGMVLLAGSWAIPQSTIAQESGSGERQNGRPGFEMEEGGFSEGGEGGEESFFAEHLETDRDSFTPSTTTVAPGRWIFESSYSFVDNRNTPERHSFPELILRRGLSERFELQLGTNYEVGGEGSSVSGGTDGGAEGAGEITEETIFLYGLKTKLSEHHGFRPQSSVIVQGRTPVSGPGTHTILTAGYVFGWELPEEWTLDSGIRMSDNEEEGDSFNTWAPSVVLRKQFAERWNVHGEYFGLFSDGLTESFSHQFFSPGIHYLISPDVEVGCRVGWGLNEQSANFFSNIGIGWRY